MLNKIADVSLSAFAFVLGTMFIICIIPFWLTGLFVAGSLDVIGNFLNRRFRD